MMLAGAMQEKIVGKVTVSPAEVQSFFDRIPKEQLPFIDFDKESRNPARHIMNLQDDYVKISNLALQEKRAQAFDTWFRINITRFYIEVDNDTQTKCKGIKKFVTTEIAGNN